jgi:transposase InsO family protein
MTVIELPLQTAARISFSTSLLEVNRKRAQRLMGILGIEALYPKPNLSRPAQGHEIYPYLLRGLSIERPNRVWSTDITYIPMRGGFLYLVAVMNWFSRYALRWNCPTPWRPASVWRRWKPPSASANPRSGTPIGVPNSRPRIFWRP